MRRVGVALAVLSSLAVAACDTLMLSSSDSEERLAGKRIPVMLTNPDLEPDPRIADLTVALPKPAVNAEWPGPGGVSTHDNQHPALSGSLKVVWTIDAGDGTDSERGLQASPVVGDGKLFAMDTAGEVRAFNAETGDELWAVEVMPEEEDEGDLGGGIAFWEGRVYVTGGFAQVLALDADSGAEIWRSVVPGPMRAGPTVIDGRVFAVTIDNQLFVLDAATGRRLWTHSGIAEVAGLLGAASPAASDEVVIVPYSSGEVVALRALNGRQLWSDSLVSLRRIDAISSLADIRGHPVIDKGRVIAISHSGRMVSIDIRSGTRVWDRSIGGVNMPWVVGEFVFLVTTKNELVAMTRRDGRIRWVRQLQRFVDEEDEEDPITWVGPVLAGNILLVAGSHGEILSISPSDGEVTGRFEAGDGVLVPPIVANETLYVLTSDGEIIALR